MSDQFFDTKVLKTLLRRTISRQNFDSTHLFESDALMIKRCVCDQEQESLTKVSRYYMIFFVKSNCLLKKVAFIRPCKFSAVACQSALFCHPEGASSSIKHEVSRTVRTCRGLFPARSPLRLYSRQGKALVLHNHERPVQGDKTERTDRPRR